MRYLNLLKNISNWPLYFKFRHVEDQAMIVSFITRKGVTVKVPRRQRGEFREIFLDESYMVALRTPLPQNPVIIDIGANVGIFTLYCAAQFSKPQVYAFEPIPTNFNILLENSIINKDYATIHCYQKAVSNISGEISLTYQHSADGFTSLASMINVHNIEEAPTIKVPSMTLLEVFEKNNISKCDLLKLDCEGAEFSILYHCPQSCLTRISQLVIEVHEGREPSYNIRALQNYLQSCGFSTKTRKGYMLWAIQR